TAECSTDLLGSARSFGYQRLEDALELLARDVVPLGCERRRQLELARPHPAAALELLDREPELPPGRVSVGNRDALHELHAFAVDARPARHADARARAASEMLETLAGDGGRARLTGQRERDRAIAALIRRRECISAAIAACAADPDRAASVCDARRLRVGGARGPRRRDRGLLLPLLLALPLRLTLLEQRLGIGRR